jgi:hypothetical protein
LAPLRRGKSTRPAGAAPDVDDLDVARGQAAAVLGALGRLQLRVDVLAREQREAFDAIQHALADLDLRIAALDTSPVVMVDEPPAEDESEWVHLESEDPDDPGAAEL